MRLSRGRPKCCHADCGDGEYVLRVPKRDAHPHRWYIVLVLCLHGYTDLLVSLLMMVLRFALY